jgi:ubiquinone/menaquinone biosynthesis C-methylase UbiE
MSTRSYAMHSEAGGHPTGSFDAVAETYDAWYATPLGELVDRLEKGAVFHLVGNDGEGVGLDLSCGTGNHALALAGRGFRVVGLDISEPMLRAARSKAAHLGLKLSLVQADAGVLPFRPGAFGLVTLILGLEFMAEPGRALSEAYRVLRPGGRLVVAILSRTAPWTLWRRVKRLFVPSVWRGAKFLSPRELRNLLASLGFADPRWRRAVHFLPLGGRGRVGWVERWEAIGARWMPATAAFVAVSVRRV